MCRGDCVLASQYSSDVFMDDLATWNDLVKSRVAVGASLHASIFLANLFFAKQSSIALFFFVQVVGEYNFNVYD